MKKYYCPYCGERSLSWHQRFTHKSSRWFRKLQEKLWHSCPNCHKVFEKRTEGRGKKIEYVFIMCALLFGLLSIVFGVTKLYALCICALSADAVFIILISVVDYKYSVFVRREPSAKDDVVAEASVNLNDDYLESFVYTLKAAKEYRNKVNVAPAYIAALSNYSREDNTCDVRFIKPREAEGLIAAGKFEVYDDDKLVGSGEFIKQDTKPTPAHIIN